MRGEGGKILAHQYSPSFKLKFMEIEAPRRATSRPHLDLNVPADDRCSRRRVPPSIPISDGPSILKFTSFDDKISLLHTSPTPFLRNQLIITNLGLPPSLHLLPVISQSHVISMEITRVFTFLAGVNSRDETNGTGFCPEAMHRIPASREWREGLRRRLFVMYLTLTLPSPSPPSIFAVARCDAVVVTYAPGYMECSFSPLRRIDIPRARDGGWI
ncbi:uncharacterized protein ARMOST_14047 [Armillaria ostoyae]|uniref:Uncharacterized protein n=1 Tax=Armillaria ostoyae TaxID=47428 RepID=A0A284RPG5_ARMOS|nr:uncharacterized protein ARMOST_14047 [Armillaria ostoyae]